MKQCRNYVSEDFPCKYLWLRSRLSGDCVAIHDLLDAAENARCSDVGLAGANEIHGLPEADAAFDARQQPRIELIHLAVELFVGASFAKQDPRQIALLEQELDHAHHVLAHLID